MFQLGRSLPVLGLLLVVGLAACGPNDGSVPKAAPTERPTSFPTQPIVKQVITPPPRVPSPTPTISPTPGATATPVPTPVPLSVEAGRAVLNGIANGVGSARYKAVYEMNAGSVVEVGAYTGDFVVASRSPAYALHIDTNINGEPIHIHDGSETYLCDDSEGAACYVFTGFEFYKDFLLDYFPQVDFTGMMRAIATDRDLKVTAMAGRTLAGHDARCFEVSSRRTQGIICADAAIPVLLLLDGRFFGYDFTLRVREVTAPSDEDFQPPWEVKELE